MTALLIEAEALRARLARPGCLIFDVRADLSDDEAGRRAYEAGHIPGALHLDLQTQLSAPCTGANGRHPLPARADFAAFMRTQGLTQRTEVVVYDGGRGMFAARLWWMLRWLGHPSVALLDGGWAAWQAAGGEAETGTRRPVLSEAQAVQGAASSGAPGMRTVDAQAVLANLDAPQFTVLDARAAPRFRGETEPMDPVAGHIPGALNRPFLDNLQADGHFKSPAVLRQEFSAVLGSVPPAAVVHQCGSGVSACHNLFAMELAGLDGSALYPGSWSEWCSDPQRPVAREAA